MGEYVLSKMVKQKEAAFFVVMLPFRIAICLFVKKEHCSCGKRAN